jgi:hypothetical protein
MGGSILCKLRDESADTYSQFSMRCEECGRLWRSEPEAVTELEPPPGYGESKRVIYEALRRRQRESARVEAEYQARLNFNICPVCGRAVCDACFRVCEDIDMCRACAEKLNEPGESPLGWRGDGIDGDEESL